MILAAPTHICIISSEIVGPFRNGGIGTAMTGLAQCLAEAGFRVTFLFTGGHSVGAAARDKWTRDFAAMGIDLKWCDVLGNADGAVAQHGLTIPQAVWQALQQIRPDIAQFNDCMGEGLYAVAMQHLGAGVLGMRTIAALHSPTEWIWDINRNLPDSMLQALFTHCERVMLPIVDALWSPSAYLLRWIKDRGFNPPKNNIVQQYVLPRMPLIGGDWPDAGKAAPAPRAIGEIVFFGRVEERKGAKIFCDAMDIVGDQLAAAGVGVTFLGKEGTIDDGRAFDYLDRRAKNWRFAHQQLSDFGQQKALTYLQSGARLAVMASPADNSPCTVYEALTLTIPFIAADTGGIGELLGADARQTHLFAYDAGALAARILAMLDAPAPPPAPRQPQADLRAAWAAYFAKLPTAPPRAVDPPRPLVILVDGGDGAQSVDWAAMLHHAGGGGVALVTHPPAADAPGGVDVLRDGTALDAWLAARGDADILLLRAGLTLNPDVLGAMRDALSTHGVDALYPFVEIDGRLALSVGACPSFAFASGSLPNGIALVRANALARARAGLAFDPQGEFFGLADMLVTLPDVHALPFARVAARADQAPSEWGVRATRERTAAFARVAQRDIFYILAQTQDRPAATQRAPAHIRRMAQRLERAGMGRLVNFARHPRVRRLLLR